MHFREYSGQFVHQPSAIPSAPIIRIDEDAGNSIDNVLGHLTLVVISKGAFSECLAGGENRSLIWEPIPICQNPRCHSAFLF